MTCVETNFPRDIFVAKLDTAASLVNALEATPERRAALAQLALPPDSLDSAFFAPVAGPTLLVLNLWGELHIPLHRHNTAGFGVNLVVDGFMSWTDSHQGGQFGAWGDDELAARADALGLDPAVRAQLLAMVAALRADYTFCGAVQEAQVKATLRLIADRIPAGATLALVLPSCWQFDGTPTSATPTTRAGARRRWPGGRTCT